MKLNGKLLTLALLSLLFGKSFGQGFINFDFEGANYDSFPAEGTFIYSTNAIPGWTPYLHGFPVDYAAYNGVSLGGPVVSIQGTNNFWNYPAIEGRYFLSVLGGTAGSGSSAAAAQTSQIPISAQSILFWGAISGGAQALFNGNILTFAVIGTTPNNYNIYQADITPYAGQVGELLFFAPHNGGAFIDNIQFSTAAVPEPSTLAFLAFGSLGLALTRCRVRR